MDKEFEGAVALVTGGGIGLGKQIAVQFAKRGAAVVVAEIVEETGGATVDEIRAADGLALFVRADVSVDDDARAMVEAAVREFGRLDFAVNNAAIEGDVKPLTEQTLETFNRVVAINLAGVFHGLRHQIPVMVAQGGGAIVNVASIAGVRGHPGLAPYVASKHGVNGLTKTAAIEYGHAGVRINSLCPGGIRTPQLDRYLESAPELRAQIIDNNPMRRLADADEMARAAIWLCSPQASYINGHELVVDGGKIASDV
ncbi:MAG: glucose 1-dehydrogenase [Hyphomonadaceae bacterium]|nr:glucose 1-dehydrogenase [Hyphomonadaceae bacterium]